MSRKEESISNKKPHPIKDRGSNQALAELTF
jgi:hypothetical protein